MGSEEEGKSKRVERFRYAKYTLLMSGAMELLAALTLIIILVASGSELFGFVFVHVLSVVVSFAAPSIVRSRRLKEPFLPMLFVPALLVDTLLLFASIYSMFFCISGDHETRFDLVLGSRICQGWSFDSGLFEYLCGIIAFLLLTITIQSAFTVTLLFESSAGSLVMALPIPRISLIFFTGVWMVRYGGYMYGVLCLASVLMQVLDFAIMSIWAIPLSIVIELPVLMPPIIHLIGWCSKEHDGLCIHDNLATAWMFLVLGIVRFVIACVQMSAMRRQYARRMSINPAVDATTAVFHVAIGAAGIFFAIYNAQYGLIVTMGVSILAHAVGSGLILTIQSNVHHLKAMASGAIGLFVFASIVDALTISVFAMSVDSKCPTWLPGWLPVKCVGPNGALIALSLSTLALCFDIISCVSAVAYQRAAPTPEPIYAPVSDKETEFKGISLRRPTSEGEDRVWSRRSHKR